MTRAGKTLPISEVPNLQTGDRLWIHPAFPANETGGAGRRTGARSHRSCQRHQGGGGAYSPYIGVVVDMAKVMESLRTAQYQYIPALALPQKEQLNLKLNNPPSTQTAIAVLDPLKSFGDSAFGPLQFRPVATDGTAGDWQPLAHLVCVPHLKEVRCPDDPEKQCILSGDLLYLIDSIATDRNFTNAVSVPSGFAETSLTVPRPIGTVLCIKLRDDPIAVNTAALTVLPNQQ